MEEPTFGIGTGSGGGEKYAAVPSDVYIAELVEYEFADIQFRTETEAKPRIVLTFQIVAGEEAGSRVKRIVGRPSKNMVPRHTLWSVTEALLQVDPTTLTTFKVADLLHKRCKIVVKTQVGDDGLEWSKITDFMQYKPKQAADI